MRFSVSELTDIIRDRRTIYPKDYTDRAVHRDIIEKVRSRIDVHKECYANCRTHSCNNFLWDVKTAGGVTDAVREQHAGGYPPEAPPPPHVNFI